MRRISDDNDLIRELQEYIEVNNKMPNAESKIKKERDLAYKIGNIAGSRLHQKTKDYINEVRINFKLSKLNKYISLCHKFGYLPSCTGESNEERKYGGWAKNFIKNNPNSEITKKLLYLQKIFPKKVNYIRNKKLEELKKFIKDHERVPSAYSKDKVEVSLARWMKYEIQENRQDVIEIVSNLPKTSFQRNFLKYKTYTLSNGSFPKYGSPLYMWYNKKSRFKKADRDMLLNFHILFELYLQGDPKASFIIKSLKEKLKI